MRKRRTEEQIIRILGEALKGNASGVCRKHGTSDATIRVAMPPAQWCNDCCSLDVMSDALTSGRALRFLTALDDASRECLDLFARTALPSGKVTERDANEKALKWKQEYNFERPHGVLGVPPALHAAQLRKQQLREKSLIRNGAK